MAAANVSILRAFTMVVKASANNAVNKTMAPSFAAGFCKMYSTNIAEVGNEEETTAQMALVVVVIVDCSYFQIPLSSSTGF